MGRHTCEYVLDDYNYLVCIGDQTASSNVWVGDNGDAEGCGYAQPIDEPDEQTRQTLCCPNCGECLDPVNHFIGDLTTDPDE